MSFMRLRMTFNHLAIVVVFGWIVKARIQKPKSKCAIIKTSAWVASISQPSLRESALGYILYDSENLGNTPNHFEFLYRCSQQQSSRMKSSPIKTPIKYIKLMLMMHHSCDVIGGF